MAFASSGPTSGGHWPWPPSARPRLDRELPFNARIARAITYMVEHYQEQPSLEAMAASGRAVALPLPAHLQALGRHQPEALPAVRHAGACQAAARRRCQRARRGAGYRAVGAEPAARSVRLLRGDDARRVQGAGRAAGDPLGPARRAARPGAARRDRARRLLAELRARGRCRGDRGVRARMGRRPAGARPGRHGGPRRTRLRARGRARRRCRSCCAAPTSRSRSGRRCCACRSAGWSATRRSPGRSASRAPTARSAGRSARNNISWLIPCHRVILQHRHHPQLPLGRGAKARADHLRGRPRAGPDRRLSRRSMAARPGESGCRGGAAGRRSGRPRSGTARRRPRRARCSRHPRD